MINDLLAANQRWVADHRAKDQHYFSNLSKGQSPEYLWVGCSDSRVPAESMLGLQPGELFVHRNVANQVQTDDPNGMSVIQFSVQALKVRHIIICGHVGCGGVKAALNGGTDQYLEKWLQPIATLAITHKETLDRLSTEDEKTTLLAELNVQSQIEQLAAHNIIKSAWEEGQSLQVHGWLFDIRVGLLKNLNISRSGIL